MGGWSGSGTDDDAEELALTLDVGEFRGSGTECDAGKLALALGAVSSGGGWTRQK